MQRGCAAPGVAGDPRILRDCLARQLTARESGAGLHDGLGGASGGEGGEGWKIRPSSERYPVVEPFGGHGRSDAAKFIQPLAIQALGWLSFH